jgi:hypothetical protein
MEKEKVLGGLLSQGYLGMGLLPFPSKQRAQEFALTV